MKSFFGKTFHAAPPLILVAAALFATAPGAASQAAPWKQIPISKLPAFHPPQPKRIQLANGMVIFLQEDHELPLITVSARIRGGSSDEPASKIGLVDLFGEVWRTGGTKSQTGDQLDDYLEIRAAKVETGGGPDSTDMSLSCLKADFDDAFKVFNDLMVNPEFRADKLDIAQKEAEDGISRRNDEIGSIGARESHKLVYGADNPYARQPEYATIAAITRKDLVDWHKTYIHPNNMILGVSGDFDSATMEAKLRAAFEAMPKGPELPREEIKYHPAKPGYYLIPKDDVNQSNIHMVALGTTRNNPDYYALSVFNEAFGGGFSSRLFNDIRTKRGLAYNVGGGIGSNFGHPGIEQYAAGTKSQSTIEAIQAIQEDIDELSTKPITEEEIQHAKDAILNAFIFRLDSPDKVLGERMTYEFYRYPADWLDKYPGEIQKVDAAEVKRVATKYLHRDQLAVLVVGNTKEFDKPMSSLGKVTEIDIAIPPPPGAAKEGAYKEEARPKPTASNPEGKALAAKVVAAMGGEAKLSGVKSIKASITLKQKTPQGEFPMRMESIIIFPDHLHATMETPQGAMTIVVTPDAAFMALPNGQSQSWPEARKNESLEQLKRDPIFIASHANDPQMIFNANGTEKVGDVNAKIVDVNSYGADLRWYVDPQTGHIMKETYPTLSNRGTPVQGETSLDDWKLMNGITLPLVRHNKQDGQDSSTAEYTALEFNPSIDPKLFEKPAGKSSEGPADKQ